jgi:putative transposase
MAYKTDLTDNQWQIIKQVLAQPTKRGRRYGEGTRQVVNALLYVAHTGCQWRYLPDAFGPWTRIWSQFRRWSENDTLGVLLTELHKVARKARGREHGLPSLVVVDTHLSRGASNGGVTFHDQGVPRGWIKGAKRVVAVDVTGLPLSAIVVPAGTSESVCVEKLASRLVAFGHSKRLDVLLADKGISAKAAERLTKEHGFEVRRYGWTTQPVDPVTGRKVFKPLKHSGKVEAAHAQLGKSRRLAKSFENTEQSATAWLNLACIAMVLNDLK